MKLARRLAYQHNFNTCIPYTHKKYICICIYYNYYDIKDIPADISKSKERNRAWPLWVCCISWARPWKRVYRWYLLLKIYSTTMIESLFFGWAKISKNLPKMGLSIKIWFHFVYNVIERLLQPTMIFFGFGVSVMWFRTPRNNTRQSWKWKKKLKNHQATAIATTANQLISFLPTALGCFSCFTHMWHFSLAFHLFLQVLGQTNNDEATQKGTWLSARQIESKG